MACGASKAGTDNAFGDEQLHVDLAADKIIFDELKVPVILYRAVVTVHDADRAQPIASYRLLSVSKRSVGQRFL